MGNWVFKEYICIWNKTLSKDPYFVGSYNHIDSKVLIRTDVALYFVSLQYKIKSRSLRVNALNFKPLRSIKVFLIYFGSLKGKNCLLSVFSTSLLNIPICWNNRQSLCKSSDSQNYLRPAGWLIRTHTKKLFLNPVWVLPAGRGKERRGKVRQTESHKWRQERTGWGSWSFISLILLSVPTVWLYSEPLTRNCLLIYKTWHQLISR